MEREGIDPAAWLAGHDIKAYIDARCGDVHDPLALGREALVLAGDLLAACRQAEDLRGEIVLAWLAEQIERQVECAPLELVGIAAGVLEDSARP